MMFQMTSKRTILPVSLIALALVAGSTFNAWATDDVGNLRRPTVCTEQYLPVCGRINTVVKTYSNACFARAAGATVIAQGPCRPSKDGLRPN
jgi:hypothetical protein